ncbi:MAG TPA: hypothetical protein VLM39_01780 [Ignavibacteriaceae bacterium]|nr:hypothetical protein [Ignavibacteriaceae bacterium]
MKKIILLIPALFLLIGFTINRIIDKKVEDILKQIDFSNEQAKNMIWSNCSYSSFWYPNPKDLKNIAAGERAGIVNSVGNYVKEFTKSEDFKKHYSEFRESKKPQEPEKPKTMDQMKDEQRESIKQGIASMKESKSKMPKDQQSMFDETIKMYEQQLKDLDDPNNPMFSKEMEGYMKQGYDQQMNDYNQKLAEWEKEYPANNANPLIKQWLTKFLEGSGDVDFNAKTKIKENNRTIFAKPEYESKSSLWKLCFRAGKETVSAGHTFAEQWMKELK